MVVDDPLQTFLASGEIVWFERYPSGWRGDPKQSFYYKIGIRPGYDRSILWSDLTRRVQIALGGNTKIRFFDAATGVLIEP